MADTGLELTDRATVALKKQFEKSNASHSGFHGLIDQKILSDF